MGSLWMIRAGKGSEYIDAYLDQRVVAMGDPLLGKLPVDVGRDALGRLYERAYPSMKDGTRASHVSQLYRFLSEVKPGDLVTTFDRERRLYLLGTVRSEWEWQPDLVPDKPCVRRVEWAQKVRRDELSTASRNSLGAIQTIFKLTDDVRRDLEAHAVEVGDTRGEEAGTASVPDAREGELRAETIEKADQFIEDAINRLDWRQMQDLIAGLLRAMGYRTTVSDNGPDRGVDIFASPDGLGLQEPRIFVEVKHRKGAMGSKDIRAFLGGRKPGDRCLYVSTGGFTKDGHYEADRASVPIKLLTLPDIRKLLVERYEGLDPETAALVPMKRLYWPVT